MRSTIFSLLALAIFFIGALPVDADVSVKGYYRKDGTYVQPHYRTSPNNTTSDNYSTKGNVNPYTGAVGTKPDTKPSTSSLNTPSPYTPSIPNIQREIRAVEWKYKENPSGFRERLIQQISENMLANKERVSMQVYSLLPDIK